MLATSVRKRHELTTNTSLCQSNESQNMFLMQRQHHPFVSYLNKSKGIHTHMYEQFICTYVRIMARRQPAVEFLTRERYLYCVVGDFGSVRVDGRLTNASFNRSVCT
ncbi:unnamed protein product [Ceratitis capitata]|uniref:(Mediterranean fruit fly) hypothetical protein n=1 Tax=Ceratitis capitata TaxID=7213 RepID=A0A811VBK3_CERCA|nr:unnamed protein product [Ceratitis capitata]